MSSASKPLLRPKVLFFDVNETLLDLHPMKKKIAALLGGNEDLVSLWFTTLLHYSLVTSASGTYQAFDKIGAATLHMVAAGHGIKIAENDAHNVINDALTHSPAHPEVKEALMKLKNDGYTLVAFTNSSQQGLKKQFEFAKLTSYFDHLLSVEEFGKFKPFTETYQKATKKLEIKPQEAMMIAAHGWDVAGAMAAGWRAAFISRPGQQVFPLASKTEIHAVDLLEVARLLTSYKK
jgi:2-haloacid dehalogenase